MSWRALMSVVAVTLVPATVLAEDAEGAAPPAPAPAPAPALPAADAAEPAVPSPPEPEEPKPPLEQQQPQRPQLDARQAEQAVVEAAEGAERPSSDEQAENEKAEALNKQAEAEAKRAEAKKTETVKTTKRKLPRPKAQTGWGVPLRVDLTGGVLYREESEGTARMFDGGPRASFAVRGARLFGNDWHRLGVWLGYRFEPGPTRKLLAGNNDTARLQSWMMAHDLTGGWLFDLTFRKGKRVAPFGRISGGAGLSITTLQLRSLDDEHIYSETTRTLHATGVLDAGVLLFGRFEVLVGVGGLLAGRGPHPALEPRGASLDLEQSDADHPTVSQRVGPVSRSGLILHIGLGVEF